MLSRGFLAVEGVVEMPQSIPLIGHYCNIGTTWNTKYLMLDGTESVSLTTCRSCVPEGKTVKLYVNVITNGIGQFETIDFWIRKNGVRTAAHLQIIGDDGAGKFVDTRDISFADLDTLDVEVTEAITVGAMACVVSLAWQ